MNYSCNSSDTDNYKTIGKLCVNGSDTTLVECVKYTDQASLVLKYIQGVWFLLIFILGTIGNLATLICIPFAVKKKANKRG